MSQHMADPPEKYPTAKKILSIIQKNIENPPGKIHQHRPHRIVFPDRNFVGALRTSLAAIEIECTYLSESDGIDDYVKTYSKMLIDTDVASSGETSENEGLLSEPGNTIEIIRGAYTAASSFASRQPWKVLDERKSIRLEFTQPLKVSEELTMPPQVVYASMLGATDVFGVVVFFSKTDLERRMVPPGEKLAYMHVPSLRKCALCETSSKNVQGDLKRCTRCQSVFYCNVTCQVYSSILFLKFKF